MFTEMFISSVSISEVVRGEVIVGHALGCGFGFGLVSLMTPLIDSLSLARFHLCECFSTAGIESD